MAGRGAAPAPWGKEIDMGLADRAAEKARQLAETAKAKADEYGVREKAAGYTEKAKAKADEYGVREKAAAYTGKAAELAGRGVEAAAAGVDKATKGRFHDQLDTVSTKAGEGLSRIRSATEGVAPAAGGTTPQPPATPPVPPPVSPEVAGQDGAPITPASTNPEAERPEGA
jgi:hypothetical protein